ncbi:MAG: DUF4293 domain-containing protein [Saprospiraceae bacterium]
MIQRIQSIFLFLAGGASFGVLGLPFATTDKAENASALFADSIFNTQDNIALMVFFGIAGLLAIIDIFLYNNRPLQIRLGMFAFIANIIGLILGIFLFFNDMQNVGTDNINDGLGAYLPIVAGVLLLLAIRFIRKDEKLVRSADRLR